VWPSEEFPDCQHRWGEEQPGDTRGGSGPGGKHDGELGEVYGRDAGRGAFCLARGCWRGALGLEPLHDCGRPGGKLCAGCYVCHMVTIFREVRRVLRDDGCLWLNMGDSFSSNPSTSAFGLHAGRDVPHFVAGTRAPGTGSTKAPGLKPKDLCGMPWRVAFALQADGWWLRRDHIIWKKNPMPESPDDRCTSAHEYVFLLTKRGRYAYDADAIREPHSRDWTKAGGSLFNAPREVENSLVKGAAGEHRGTGPPRMNPTGRNKRSVWQVDLEPDDEDYCPCCGSPVTGEVWHIATDQSNYEFCNACKRLYVGGERKHIKQYEIDGKKVRECSCGETTAWVAHFAAMPRKVVRTCIRAGSSEAGCCAECGAPRERVVEKETSFEGGSGAAGRTAEEVNTSGKWAGIQYGTNLKLGPVNKVTTLGFSPTCDCETEETESCVVLDPFGGSGTSAIVAVEEGRDYVLIDLSDEYCELARERIARVSAQPRLDF